METFQKGDMVWHKTNRNFPMIVTDVNAQNVQCRWVDARGVKREEWFLDVELTKQNPLTLGVI